jgi:bile acid:Na+ symporter, BASS family
MASKLTLLFPIFAILGSLIAFFYPTELSTLKPLIIPLLALVMFTMGLTLTLNDFKAATKQPKLIGLALFIQFFFMPLFAWIIAATLSLPTELFIGLILVGSSAGGTASNVICFLAKGNVALSILMTLSSTLCATALMPVLTYLYLDQSIPVPISAMIQSIIQIVFLPVLTGTLVNTWLATYLHSAQRLLPIISSLAIITIIAIIVALNHDNLLMISMPVIIAVMLHNILGLTIGYQIPKLLHYDQRTCRTLAIEVGMQNSGLSVALAIKYFSITVALPGALFSIWHNISGSILASFWQGSHPDSPQNK